MVRKKKNTIVAVIPAKGGSKSIPGKNIKMLGQFPLIAYSIAAGLESRHVTRVIVSTDDLTVAEVAKTWGAEVPFMRPSELAGDNVQDLPVLLHGLNWLQKHGGVPDLIVHLRPASPFRPALCVDEAVQIMLDHPEADCVRGITCSGQNPYKMWRIENGHMRPLFQSEFKEPYNMPRQELPPTYWQTGHIDVIRAKTILEKNSLTGDVILPYIISQEFAVDLDNLFQWHIAETMLPELASRMVLPESSKVSFSAIQLIISDFDGVMTDDHVWVDQTGRESVMCSRSDGMAVNLLKGVGVRVVVLSTEENQVVKARCDKLRIRCYQGIRNKAVALYSILKEYKVNLEQVAYIGNDINDLECMERVGLGIAVADAHPDVRQAAHLILSSPGGKGAFRELVERIITAKKSSDTDEG